MACALTPEDCKSVRRPGYLAQCVSAAVQLLTIMHMCNGCAVVTAPGWESGDKAISKGPREPDWRLQPYRPPHS